MWNQWSAGPPPMPPPSSSSSLAPLIGPVQPSAIAPPPTEVAPTGAGVPVQQVAAYSLPSGAPSYTPAQYAAMTPEQQYAVQQHWQQWQAYEQQYAQWHAQYGEQYKREMAAIHGGPPPAILQYGAPASQNIASSFAYPPPAVTNVYQAPPAPAQAPPPPPPAEKKLSVAMNPPLQIYEQPPPPPPPPQPEKNIVNDNADSQSISVENMSGAQQHQDNQWCQPPPQTQGSRMGESVRQQSDRQQNQYDQYTNNNKRGNQNNFNSPLDQQNNNQGRDYRQAHRPVNDFQGRTLPRGGNNFDNRKQPNDEFEGRNTRQSDSIGQRNSRDSIGGRFDNYDSYNKNMGQNVSGRQGWNNISRGNTYSSLDNQKQQQTFQQNSIPVNNTNNNVNNANTSSGSLDESAFDEQFRLWEEQFENWKKENANHPDRDMYMQYEREFEKTRIRLLERREQMRRRKLMELQQSQPEQPLQQKIQPPQQQLQATQQNTQPHGMTAFQEPEKQRSEKNANEMSVIIPEQASDIKMKKVEDVDLLSTKPCTELTIEPQDSTRAEIEQINDTTGLKKNEISELFKPADGIPGLDLVASNDEHNDGGPSEDALESEVIDLDNDGPSRPPKIPATLSSVAGLIPLSAKQSAEKTELPDLVGHAQVAFSKSQIHQKKIPSLFDIMVEKPTLSPSVEQPNKTSERDHSPTESRSSKIDIRSATIDSHSRSISRDREALASPGQRPSSQLSLCNSQVGSQPCLSQQTQQSNLPPPVADLAKVLQDPNVMQLLTAALAQAQSGGFSQSGNAQQVQLIQQLQKLQPLIQMQQQEQGLNSNIQPWNNLQSQQWQSQNQNSIARDSITSNRNSWGGNPFNRSNDSISLNRSNESLPFNRDDNSLPFNRGNESFPLSRRPGSGHGSGFGSGAIGPFRSELGSRFGSGLSTSLGSGFGTGDEFDDNNDLQQRNPHNPFRRSFGNVENKPFSDELRNAGVRVSYNENKNQRMTGSFGGLENAQQSRIDNFGGNTRFDNSRPNMNFGNNLGFRNNANSFGDRGGNDNEYYRPTQVFDYQNRSRSDAIVPASNVVDYGHKPSTVMSTNSSNRNKSEFVPVKTIDYGHSSNSVQNENQSRQNNSNVSAKNNRWNENQNNYSGNTQIKEKHLKITSEPVQKKGVSLQNKNSQDKQSHDVKIEHKNFMAIDEENKNLLTHNESLAEMENDLSTQYPHNKWVLLNPEQRMRKGAPTKRGKRHSGVLKDKLKSAQEEEFAECDEIEENFEEISDNEDLNENIDISLENMDVKTKSRHLFPSVSNSVSNTIVFPSMENNNTIPIDEILFKPGRLTRPKNIVIILRGPPGSGKSHVAKLIKDKEVEMGGATPRLLSIDDYFMIENDYEEKCPKTGRKIPKKEILYEYEKEMEDTYMQYLIKSFKKTVTDHLYDFIIVDCCNQSLRTFNEFYNAARDGNFSPFVIDLICDIETCLNQNIHNRKESEIREVIKNYQECPGHYIKLDVSNLLENVVEMEDVSDLEDHFVADSGVVELDEEDDAKDNNVGGFLKSKWDTDPTTENLARLDGTSKPISKRGTATLEEYLQIDGWEPPTNTSGKKTVRWADIEEKRAQDKMRAIGFVVGQTDWNRMMDPTSGSGALTKTKYIERLNKRR